MKSDLELEFPYPKNFVPGDEILFKNDIKRILPQPKIQRLKNTCITVDGIIFKNLKIYDQFLIWKTHKKDYNLFYLLKIIFSGKKIRLSKSHQYIACFDYWSHGYFHWMCDFLPRLSVMEDQIDNSVLIVPEWYKASFFQDSLKAFHVKNIFRLSGNNYLQCDLLVPEHVAPSGEHNPDIILQVRNRLIEYYKHEFENKFGDKIYVSRAKSRYRKIKNEEEVIEVLKQFGFTTIFFEDYSLSQQIAIAYYAKQMISLHGANMTNLMFMQPGTNVLEFRKNTTEHVNSYFSLASAIGVNYFYQSCDYVNLRQKGGNAFDVKVDIDKLRENVNLMLGN